MSTHLEIVKAEDGRINLVCGDLITYRLTEDQALNIAGKLMRACKTEIMFDYVDRKATG
jgi:hypothetical protein